jgi:hypothetical protein
VAWLQQLLEWIEDLSRPLEAPVVPRGDRQAVPASGCRDVAVLDRHALAGLVEKALFEPMDPAVQRFDETCEPRLKCLSLSTFLGADPVRQLCDDDGTRVAAVLF